MAGKGASSTYEIRTRFRAPLDFVYRWCTDYTAQDARLEGERYERRILKRTSNEVVYEDLDDLDGGWFWSRMVFRLHPPDRWHAESVGSHRTYSLDYRLSALPNRQTLLTLPPDAVHLAWGVETPRRPNGNGTLARAGRPLPRSWSGTMRGSAGSAAGKRNRAGPLRSETGIGGRGGSLASGSAPDLRHPLALPRVGSGESVQGPELAGCPP